MFPLLSVHRSGDDSHPADLDLVSALIYDDWRRLTSKLLCGPAMPRDSGDSRPTVDIQETHHSVNNIDSSQTDAIGSKFETPPVAISSNDTYTQKRQSLMALYLDAYDFHRRTPEMIAAWNTIKELALDKGVELTLSNSGIVQAESRGGESAPRKKHPADDQWYTLAETIEFVFAQGGSFAFAMKMWSNEMVEAS